MRAARTRGEPSTLDLCADSRRGVRSLATWEESPQLARGFMRAHRTQNFVLPDLHVYRKKIIGQFANKDVVLPIA